VHPATHVWPMRLRDQMKIVAHQNEAQNRLKLVPSLSSSRIGRDHAHREKPPGAHCLERRDDKWHLQTLLAAAARFLPHSRRNSQCL